MFLFEFQMFVIKLENYMSICEKIVILHSRKKLLI